MARAFDAVSADIYAARSGIDAKKISAMLDRETWISGGQAVEQGFADGLLSADELDLSDADEGRASARAERKFDVLASKAGVSRSEARELLAALKGSKPGAAPASMHDAAVAAEVRNLLNFAKTI